MHTGQWLTQGAWMMEDGAYKAQLIASKNRIAPVKIVDIVRLELSGVVIGKRLRVFVQAEVRYTFTAVYYIVDSEIVKAMISKESYGAGQCLADRPRILEATNRRVAGIKPN